MELQVKKITYDFPDICVVEKMMKSLFAEAEQSEISELLQLSNKLNTEFIAYYKGTEMIGFSFALYKYDYMLIYYLAIKKEHQAKGYGSSILYFIKNKHKDKTIILNIESVYVCSDNYSERYKRLRFYINNGFVETYAFLEHGGVVYDIIASEKDINLKAYKLLLDNISDTYKTSRIFKNKNQYQKK